MLREMALSGSVTTCLSLPVHYLICQVGFEKKDTYDINSILSENGEVCWQAVTEHVCYLESDQSVDYIKSIRSLGPVCESVYLHFKSLTKEQFVIQYALWFHWTNCTELFLEVFDVLQHTQTTEVALGLMKLTSCLERALGDVYLLIGKDCPFLLRDLLASEQLAVVFGQTVMNVLRVFIGSPYGLNLRNVLWHGFASPKEIPAKYADCVILLLPQLEVGLRLLFTTANKCQNRLLTAESSALYTTFDEMLAKHLDNEEVNQLPSVLEEPAMEFLWDFLNHQEGPRVRDRLSHGEIDLEAFPREVANQIVAFAITLLCRFSDEDMFAFKEHMVIKPLMNCASCYCSRFHPISRLKKQVLECMKSVHLWPELPTVPEEHVQTIKGLLIELCDTRICTLYSPRPVLEILVILRKISTQCHQVSEQVIASTKLRYKQWMSKTLRSRQRHNYLRMLSSMKFLSPMLRLILVLMTVELVNIHLVCKKNPSDYQQYLKFLKSVLQYTENLATYTSPEKNKWDETLELTNKTLIKIKRISDRKLMLMQLTT
ncbi:endoplasmic reticulum membrane-associated RNA degradation protein isoform 3-T9 [Amazona ochrocephala]